MDFSMEFTSKLNLNEIWKDVKGYEGVFQISNLGRLKRLRSYKRENARFLSPQLGKRGYYVYSMCYNYKMKTKTMHRLVAEHFISNPENKREVNHIDANKLNNSIENLEWVTTKENSMHAAKLTQKKKSNLKVKRGAIKQFYKGRLSWASHLRTATKCFYLGSFKTKEAAHEAYKVKYFELYGFNPW